MKIDKTAELLAFEQNILVHLSAAYNYAHWLTRNSHDAEDLTQEACTRAFAAFENFERQNAKAWLLTIIRHTFLNQNDKEKHKGEVIYLDTLPLAGMPPEPLQNHDSPERILLRDFDKQSIHRAIDQLAPKFREVIVLRVLEELSYHDIARITDCAMGTVMSRLSRARDQLKKIMGESFRDLEHHA